MQKIFKEYGGVITVAVAIVCLIGIVGMLLGGAGGGAMGNAFNSVVDKFEHKIGESIDQIGSSNGVIDTSRPITDYTLIEGKTLNTAGQVADSTNYMVTDFIPCKEGYDYIVTENQTYQISEGSNTVTRCLVYDENQELIQTAYTVNRTNVGVYSHEFSTVRQAAYFRVLFRITDTDITITEVGPAKAFLEYTNGSYIQGISVSDDYLFVSYSATAGNQNKNDYQIRKVNRSTGELISTSTEYFNHANGMAYNEKTDELVVCALNGDTGTEETTCDDDYSLYIVDADTLSLKSTKNLKDVVISVCAENVGISGVAYNSNFDEYYVFTRYPERHIITLNNDFTFKSSVYLYDTDDLPGTTGDIACDDNYFYIPTWRSDLSATYNEVAIYTRDGNLLETKPVNGITHIEAVDIINGKIYASFIDLNFSNGQQNTGRKAMVFSMDEFTDVY